MDLRSCYAAASTVVRDPSALYVADLLELLPEDDEPALLRRLAASYVSSQAHVRQTVEGASRGAATAAAARVVYRPLCWWDGRDRFESFASSLRHATVGREPLRSFLDASGATTASVLTGPGLRLEEETGGSSEPRLLAPTIGPASHVLVTRFMLGQEHMVSLLEARLKIFKAVCLPSIIAQTSTRFVWIVYARVALWPEKLATELVECLDPHPHVVLARRAGSFDDGVKDTLTARQHLARAGLGPGGGGRGRGDTSFQESKVLATVMDTAARSRRGARHREARTDVDLKMSQAAWPQIRLLTTVAFDEGLHVSSSRVTRVALEPEV